MASLKTSAYNFLVPQADHTYILYNSASGCTVLLDNATGRAVIWLFQNPNKTDNLGQNLSRLKDGLVRGAFLVSDDYDEGEAIRKRHEKERNDVCGLNLTVAVTLSCNFRCLYCSQNRELRHMSLRTAEHLLLFVSSMLPEETHLSVTWYGGEPLLNKPIVDHLSRNFKGICAKKRAGYSAMMITNGYRLNKSTADKLAEVGIRDFQITVDGDRTVHDKSRPLLGGQGTFDVILKNVCDILPSVGEVAIRINVLRSTTREAAEAYRRFLSIRKEHRNLRPYLARVFESDESCIAADDILSIGEFSALAEELNALVESEADCDIIPPPIQNVCGADRKDSFVVDPSGKLFKCWNSIGRGDECIGEVASYAPETSAWLQFDPTGDPECRSCKFLPICLGGCLDARFRARNGEKECCAEKFVLQKRLAKWARSMAGNPSS